MALPLAFLEDKLALPSPVLLTLRSVLSFLAVGLLSPMSRELARAACLFPVSERVRNRHPEALRNLCDAFSRLNGDPFAEGEPLQHRSLSRGSPRALPPCSEVHCLSCGLLSQNAIPGLCRAQGLPKRRAGASSRSCVPIPCCHLPGPSPQPCQGRGVPLCSPLHGPVAPSGRSEPRDQLPCHGQQLPGCRAPPPACSLVHVSAPRAFCEAS